MLIVFDDVIADMKTNEKLKANVAELFIRLREFNISHFAVPKAVRLKATHYFYFIMK